MAGANYLQLFEELTGARLLDGENYIRCPIHQGNSFNFAINTRKGLWICHRGCGEGNAWQLAGAILGLSPLSAIAYVQQFEQGLTEPTGLLDMLEELRGKDYESSELPLFIPNRHGVSKDRWPKWWRERGFDERDWDRWEAAMEQTTGSVILPVYDISRRMVGEIRRRMPGVEPKYLYTQGLRKSHVLFGSWLFSSSLQSYAVLVEGPLDAVACWKAGVPAMAVLGPHVSDHQMSVLRQLRVERVVLAFDNDKAGREATGKAIKKMSAGFDLRVLDWRDQHAKDVAELSEQALVRLVDQAMPALLYVMGDVKSA